MNCLDSQFENVLITRFNKRRQNAISWIYSDTREYVYATVALHMYSLAF